MRKIISIFLLAIFLFDFFGYFPIFKAAQYKIQKEIKTLLKKGVPENELNVIIVPVEKVNDLDWKREGKEFRHNGNMYDIVRHETKDGNIHYYCVNDTQETQLFVHLEELVNKQMNNDKSPAGKTAKSIAKMFGFFKYIPSDNFVFIPDLDETVKDFNYSVLYSSVFLEILTPPPNKVV